MRWPWQKIGARVEVVHVLSLGEEDRQLLRALAAPRALTLEFGPETLALVQRVAVRAAEGAAQPSQAGVSRAPDEDDLQAEAELEAAIRIGAAELLAAGESLGHILTPSEAEQQAREMLAQLHPRRWTPLGSTDDAATA